MIKVVIFLLSTIFIVADSIKIEFTSTKTIGDILSTNAKITQLSNQQQEIVSILGGHIESYYVKQGAEVKSGDRVVLIKSLELSKMTAEYLSLKKQIEASQLDLNTAQELYQKGVGSKQERNSRVISLQEIKSKKNTLISQLKALGISTDDLNATTDELILYAHADGVVSELLVPLHSTVNAQTPLIRLVNQSGYYAVAYLSVDRAMQIDSHIEGWLTLAKQRYRCSFVQLLPKVDPITQQAQILFKIDDDPKKLLLGAYAQIDISIPPYREAVMIKRSALSLFDGEWVIFLPLEDEAHEDADHTEHKDHDEHDEVPYTPQVVQIIDYSGESVAVEGVSSGVEYVSSGVYFVKSMLLRSSLGGHGH